ncbi:MAG: hypothetical protein AB8B82_09700 [Roseovarius sp.]
MIQPKRLITAGGTLACALGIGYFMQAGAEPPQAQAAAQQQAINVATDAAVEKAQEDAAQSDVQVEEVILTSASAASAIPTLPQAPEVTTLPDEPVVNAALEDAPMADDLPAEEAAPNFACEYELTATPEAAAMVRLTLDAPCMSNERFTLHHNGMMFTQATDTDGKIEFMAPALTENAVFIVAFANGEGAVANTTVSSLEYYDRAVVQWKGQSGMQVHALEYGSTYGDEGHVSLASTRDHSAAALGEGGFMTRLGSGDVDNALVAEVYTFPSGMAKRDGDVVLSVEAEITAANCGRDIEAQSLQTTADGSLKTQDLVLAMPDCNTVGDFLVLNNLLSDLKIAGN